MRTGLGLSPEPVANFFEFFITEKMLFSGEKGGKHTSTAKSPWH
jgi:hypothetical protein